MIWMARQCTLSKFADDTKQAGEADIPEGHGAIQRDPDTLEKWPDRNLRKFKKSKCKVLHLRRNHRHPYILGAERLESSLAEKGVGKPGGH